MRLRSACACPKDGGGAGGSDRSTDEPSGPPGPAGSFSLEGSIPRGGAGGRRSLVACGTIAAPRLANAAHGVASHAIAALTGIGCSNPRVPRACNRYAVARLVEPPLIAAANAFRTHLGNLHKAPLGILDLLLQIGRHLAKLLAGLRCSRQPWEARRRKPVA